MAALERNGDPDAFRAVYLIPAMRKVNQALGRLVRGPGQSAQIVLHCRRFAETATAGLLAPEYRGGVVVRNDSEWAERVK
jgi:Rad3-related DNA helicase